MNSISSNTGSEAQNWGQWAIMMHNKSVTRICSQIDISWMQVTTDSTWFGTATKIAILSPLTFAAFPVWDRCCALFFKEFNGTNSKTHRPKPGTDSPIDPLSTATTSQQNLSNNPSIAGQKVPRQVFDDKEILPPGYIKLYRPVSYYCLSPKRQCIACWSKPSKGSPWQIENKPKFGNSPIPICDWMCQFSENSSGNAVCNLDHKHKPLTANTIIGPLQHTTVMECPDSTYIEVFFDRNVFLITTSKPTKKEGQVRSRRAEIAFLEERTIDLTQVKTKIDDGLLTLTIPFPPKLQ